MAQKQILTILNSGMVLDRGVFIGLPAQNMLQIIHNIRAEGKRPLCIVDNVNEFFTPQSLLALIAAKDKSYLLVNEALGDFFTDKQIQALTGGEFGGGDPFGGQGENLNIPAQANPMIEKEMIVDLDKILQPVNPGYDFAKVPEGWSVDTHMSLGPTKIRRKMKNSDGDGTLFFMEPGEFKSLWIFASKVWAGIPGAPLKADFNTGLGYKATVISPNSIDIGGNFIRRYELEQVALHRGWAVPQLQAA